MNKFTVLVHQHKEMISNHIRQYGCWESITTEVLIEIFRSNSNVVFVDIGANIGWFSLVAASEGIRTIAFEPVTENSRIFRNSIELNKFNGLITLHTIAIGKNNGHLILNVSKENMGLCSVRDIGNDYHHNELCTQKKLDDFFGHDTPSLIVKIDVEHMELDVLQGMKKILPLVTHIIIEISFYQAEIFNILREQGFNTVVNMGFDHKTNKKSVRVDNNYLKGGQWFHTLDNAEKLLKGLTGNSQSMYLFIRSVEGPVTYYTGSF